MKSELENILILRRQEHLLAFWDELAEADRQTLAEQIRRVDFAALAGLVSGKQQATDWNALAARADSPPAVRLSGAGNRFSVAEARASGDAALKRGELGMILVAGGQGTRLGFDHPKGMYSIGPVSGASLFQILFEKVLALSRRHGVRVPLYLMTSPATHDETIAYLEEKQRFGLPSEDLFVFCQGQMPAVDIATGRVLLEAMGRLALSPDGHGGTLAALAASGGLDDMGRRGLRQLFYFQVDNPLTQIGDPEFLGYHLLAGSEMSTQVVAKRDPQERVGNVVAVDGRLQIIEYSDLADEFAERRNPDGSLVLWAGNTAIHLFDLASLQRMRSSAAALPFHIARKKVPHLDAAGRRIEPEQPNAIKFERFIFDLLPQASQAIVVEVDPARAFAPVKNAPGAERDSPDTARTAMIAMHADWLCSAGATIDAGIPVEINPLYALASDDLRGRISPGLHVTQPTYFC